MDSLSSALVVHMLRAYVVFTIKATKKPSGLGPKSLNMVINYIEDNLQHPIALDDLAAIAGVSRFHFLRMFKMSTSMSPMAYLERSRIRRAQEMIRTTDMPLCSIAQSVGFADQSHFGRRFQVHAGLSPGRYRRALK